MTIPEDKKIRLYIKCTIAVLVVVLLVLSFLFVQNYLSLRRARIVNAHELWLSLVLKDHGPLPASDIGIVRPWMTFDYVNKLFGISPNYLRADLGLTDPRYPKLSLSGYAKTNHLTIASFTVEVQGALQSYFMDASSTGASTTVQ